jgi:FtsP/CotA-like multicopper oxidase with cupredoxin domain
VHVGCAGDGDPARRLLLVTTSGTPVSPGAADDADLVSPVRDPATAATLTAQPTVQRTFSFTEFQRGFTVATTTWPNGAPKPGQFDPAETDFYITQTAASDGEGTPVQLVPFMAHNQPPNVVVHLHGADSVTEQWTIENDTLEVHAFHMHQIHFRDVTAGDGNPDHEPVLDTVSIPAAPNIDGVAGEPGVRVLKLTFTKAQIGEFVFHCHILEHEDNGMMAKIQVVAD